ncbi:MAG: hypothetical protein C4346_04085, partial [Chloroflexota bacterium]
AGREAVRCWTCPTLNFGLADSSGAIAYQCIGAISPDFPYPLSGTWSPEDRAPRAEHLLAVRQPHTLAT